jgi:hypothetical protein
MTWPRSDKKKKEKKTRKKRKKTKTKTYRQCRKADGGGKWIKGGMRGHAVHIRDASEVTWKKRKKVRKELKQNIPAAAAATWGMQMSCEGYMKSAWGRARWDKWQTVAWSFEMGGVEEELKKKISDAKNRRKTTYWVGAQVLDDIGDASASSRARVADVLL